MVDEKIRWDIAKPKKHFTRFFKSHPEKQKYILEFESDVTENPYYHKKYPRRIKKLATEDYYPPESYRWKRSDIRIVYSIIKEEKIVLPLDANVAGGIGYR